jgi:hypothetical protein
MSDKPYIRTAAAMRGALRHGEFAGVILYQGASLLDGAPIVAIATKILQASTNSKTGRMVQTFIIRSDVHPMEALRNGADASICGDCPHRPKVHPLTGQPYRTCYVNVSRSVASVYRAFTRGRYARPGIDYDPRILADLFADLAFRAGTYGDPTAAPFQVWRRATLKARAITGYSHQWRTKKFQSFRLLCMASADSVADMDAAQALGWRTFRVRSRFELTRKGEVICPASAEAGHKTDCASCKACGGTSAKAKASIVIMAHGASAKRFNSTQEGVSA